MNIRAQESVNGNGRVFFMVLFSVAGEGQGREGGGATIGPRCTTVGVAGKHVCLIFMFSRAESISLFATVTCHSEAEGSGFGMREP